MDIRGQELFIAPISVPNISQGLRAGPKRIYFLFNEPFDTKDLDIYDKMSVKAGYDDVRGRVEESLSLLRSLQGEDIYRHPAERMLYERLTGKKAPIDLSPLY